MITLDFDEKTERRFNKLLSLHGRNYGKLVNSLYDYRVNELKKGIRSIELDITAYEKKYNMKSSDFYTKYESGDFGDESHKNDFMIWSSEYESFLEFQNELNQLQ